VNGPRTAGTGRRFELVLLRIRPPNPETVGVIAKHASPESYHWMLVLAGSHAGPGNVARLLAVAYLDEASGLLGRGDPRWAIPRAFLRKEGGLDPTVRGLPESAWVPDELGRELEQIASWLESSHDDYLTALRSALRGRPDDRFRALSDEGAETRGFRDPSGRALLAPHPPPIVTRTGPGAAADRTGGPDRLLPWRR
jgi:hypothetical protein